MTVEDGRPVQYCLSLDEKAWPISDRLGEKISVRFSGKITCVECGRTIKKTYNQGYCYPCFADLPENAPCSIKPETCVHESGNEQDREFFRDHCNVDHFVYLSLTSGVKVGVTRQIKSPTRWIDQGAVQALVIARTPQRKFAGQIEVALAQHMADKTNWRKMLKGEVAAADLKEVRGNVLKWFPENLRGYALEDEPLREFEYPILKVPEKIVSHNLDKIGEFADTLWGIKGQYLIFENRVINLRKYSGYHVEFEM